MTAILNTSIPKPHTTVRSTFGRQVKPEEFDAFKADVLKTYANSHIQINPDEIKPEFCFTRKKLPIPIINWLFLELQAIRDRELVSKNIDEEKAKEGDSILVIQQTKRLLPYFNFEKWFFNNQNKDLLSEIADEEKLKLKKPTSLILMSMQDMTKKLKKFTFDLFDKDLKAEYRFNSEKKNERYLVTQFKLKEKPEALQA